MTPKITLLPADENGKELKAFYKPGTHCSRCHQAIAPPKSPGIYMPHGSGYNVFLIERCESCSCISLVEYKGVSLSPFRNFNEPRFQGMVCDIDLSGYRPIRIPNDPLPETFSDIIRSISPRFEKIYNEAKRAEELHLFEICGMGYRKALEFLVKDYLCHFDPDQRNSYVALPLAKAIEKISDPDLSTLLKAGKDLGNDETHYFKELSEYDSSDLRDLLLHATKLITVKARIPKAQKISDKTESIRAVQKGSKKS